MEIQPAPLPRPDMHAALLSLLQSVHAIVEGVARQNVREHSACADALLRPESIRANFESLFQRHGRHR